jgi:hypothetical protein
MIHFPILSFRARTPDEKQSGQSSLLITIPYHLMSTIASVLHLLLCFRNPDSDPGCSIFSLFSDSDMALIIAPIFAINLLFYLTVDGLLEACLACPAYPITRNTHVPPLGLCQEGIEWTLLIHSMSDFGSPWSSGVGRRTESSLVARLSCH